MYIFWDIVVIKIAQVHKSVILLNIKILCFFETKSLKSEKDVFIKRANIKSNLFVALTSRIKTWDGRQNKKGKKGEKTLKSNKVQVEAEGIL